MPIVVKDYNWEQSSTSVIISVPLKGASATKVDVLTTEKYVKAHYPPYFFECLLYEPINFEESVVKVGNGIVQFTLKKVEHVEWPQLHSPLTADKEAMKQARTEAIDWSHQHAEEREKKLSEAKRKREKYALNEAMRIDGEKREHIQNVKDQIKQEAHESMEKWKEEKRLQTLQEEKMLKEKNANLENEIFACKVEKSEIPVTPVRNSGSIAVTFTHRVFPTAARESTAADEEKWLKKNAEHKRLVEIEDANLTPEEKNPQYLRDKGNQFFQFGDYQAAINAYSHAIRLGSKMPALYSNRAACHLKMRNFFKCIEDASTALEHLTPPVAQNASSRYRAHVRRGTAFCELELYVEGLQDYEAALKINSSSEELKADAEKIRQIIQCSTDVPDK